MTLLCRLVGTQPMHIDGEPYLADLDHHCFRHARDVTDVVDFVSLSGQAMADRAGLHFCPRCEAPLLRAGPHVDPGAWCPLCRLPLAGFIRRDPAAARTTTRTYEVK